MNHEFAFAPHRYTAFPAPITRACLTHSYETTNGNWLQDPNAAAFLCAYGVRRTAQHSNTAQLQGRVLELDLGNPYLGRRVHVGCWQTACAFCVRATKRGNHQLSLNLKG